MPRPSSSPRLSSCLWVRMAGTRTPNGVTFLLPLIWSISLLYITEVSDRRGSNRRKGVRSRRTMKPQLGML
ncbi:hypothetical protein BC827DRAFT_1208960 [Russula dissimulans]|nr:hypothetical protein BC827DRAFT_1208960 [Russula dissimulans]